MDCIKEEDNILHPISTKTWKVLIVDDDDEVHKVTQVSLSDFSFEEKNIEFISAYSGNEAKKILRESDDIALVLLDVVMESDDAGLKVSKYIRNELENHFTRVVLRTGQPGFAPIDDVMQDYDIDGYLAKTEITKHKLNHTCYIALRSYRDLIRIQKYQKGLEAVINAIANLTQIDEVLDLAQAVITQLGCVLNAEQAEFVIQNTDIFSLTQSDSETWRIIIDAEKSVMLNKTDKLDKSNQYIELSNKALSIKQSLYEPPHYVNYYQSKRGTETIFLLKTEQKLTKESKKLLHAFSVQVVLTLENLLIK
jgi:CheY-like chemotaxis protein